MNVVSSWLSSLNGIWWNLHSSSSFEENGSSTQLRRNVIQIWKHVVFMLNSFIETLEIYAQTHITIFLSHWHNWRAPISRFCNFHNNAIVFKSIEFGFHFWHKRERYPTGRRYTIRSGIGSRRDLHGIAFHSTGIVGDGIDLPYMYQSHGRCNGTRS